MLCLSLNKKRKVGADEQVQLQFVPVNYTIWNSRKGGAANIFSAKTQVKAETSMQPVLLLIRYGEIALKGKNRPFFENRLLRNIEESLKGLETFDDSYSRGRY